MMVVFDNQLTKIPDSVTVGCHQPVTAGSGTPWSQTTGVLTEPQSSVAGCHAANHSFER